MSNLEGAVKPVLLPLIRGESRHLTDDDQALLAFWTIKTAMMLEFTASLRFIPSEHFREMYLNRGARQPLRQCQVLLAAHSGTRIYVGYSPHALVPTPARSDSRFPHGTKAYGVTLTLNHFVAQLFAHNVKDVVLNIEPVGFERAVIKIWPAHGAVNWPPPLSVSDASLPSIEDAFAHLNPFEMPA